MKKMCYDELDISRLRRAVEGREESMKTTKGLNAKKTEAREYQTGASGIFFTVKDVLYEGQSKFQRIEIIRNKDYGRVLLLDGLVQTTERDEFYYHEMLVHPALCSHARPAKVLIIGGGDGGALREVLKHPVRKAWLVEIDGHVVEACREHFPWLRATFRDPRAELIVADGNVFIDKVRERFDVILVDSSDPVGPSTVLHQEAFYRKLKAKLNPRKPANTQRLKNSSANALKLNDLVNFLLTVVFTSKLDFPRDDPSIFVMSANRASRIR